MSHNRIINQKTANRLIHQTSPYLLQHAYNPVDWYPWGPDALEKALREDKPILLSIGYSACHWCHVMERECFEEESIAQLMNRHFVNIKVDREERPDLDAIYMNYVQMLTGSGGWPLNVFLTPDQSPIHGGTYFPPEDRFGRPGFPRILQAVHQVYQTKKEEIRQHSHSLLQNLEKSQFSFSQPTKLSPHLLDIAYRNLSSLFDWKNGGFRGVPKFPSPTTLDFCLFYYARTGHQEALQFVELTLQKMAEGGIYDQLGGGFHRYSVDNSWRVPHFEKMLYDNALLSRLYLHAYQATKNPLFERIVHETLWYVLREMTSETSSRPSGIYSVATGNLTPNHRLFHFEKGSSIAGFYSSQDADSDGEEGKFFLWSLEEIQQLLTSEMSELICHIFGVTKAGNFEGRNILCWLPQTNPKNGLEDEEQNHLLSTALQTLFTAREKRTKPFRDEKILVAWNGLMLAAFAEAGIILDQPEYLRVACQNAEYLWDHAFQDGHLTRTCTAGSSDKIPGFLEDYANLAQGLVLLFEAVGEKKWLERATLLADRILAEFWDEAQACFFLTSRRNESLILRPMDVYDHATPAGGSTAALVLFHLFYLTDENRYYRAATTYTEKMAAAMEQAPTGFGQLLCASTWQLGPVLQFVIRGNPTHPITREFQHVLSSFYLPLKTVGLSFDSEISQNSFLPIFEGKANDLESPACYVCHDQSCLPPITHPEELRHYLAALRPGL